MSDSSRREFLRGLLGAGFAAAAVGGLSGSCDITRENHDEVFQKKRGVGRGRRKDLDETLADEKSLEPEELVGESIWEGERFEQAQARLRTASVLAPNDLAEWVVFDVAGSRPVHQEVGKEWNRPERFDLGWLGSILCAYTAMQTGHLEVGEGVVCRGDPGVPRGHGRINVVEALRVGCRSFFQRVSDRFTFEEFRIGARLLGLEKQLPARPDCYMERIGLYAQGKGLEVTLKDLQRMGIRLARGDRGDFAMQAVRLGLLNAVRSGFVQKAGVPGMGIAGTIGFPRNETGEALTLLWTPFGKARFLLLARTLPETDPAELAARIFKTLQLAQA